MGVSRTEGEDAPGAAPMFSIMCSAYRCEEYLPATIESVLAQTSDDWELIVVDNGMSDPIAEIVGRYGADGRVRLIRQENRRLVGGITAAAAMARGRYLVPLDSDDLLLPQFCARMAAVLHAHPEIDGLSCDTYLFARVEEPDRARTFLRSAAGVEHSLSLLDLIGTHDVAPYFGAFRREAWFAVGGFTEGSDLVEDISLLLRLVGAGHDVRVLPEALSRYRIRPDSASRDPSGVEAFEVSRERAYIAAARQSGDPAVLAALGRRLRGLRYERALRAARWAFTRGDLPGARAAAMAAFRQRRTPRVAAVLAGLAVAPHALRLIHPVKGFLGARVARLAARAVAVRRG